MTTNTLNTKHRPSLTRAEIEYLSSLACKELPLTPMAIHIVSKFNVLLAKLDNKGIKPAYVPVPSKPKANSLEALGALGADTTALERLKDLKPSTIGELRKVLGLIGDYGKYVPDFARKAKPLYDLLKAPPDSSRSTQSVIRSLIGMEGA